MTRASLVTTPFQHANLMLRNGEWEQALSEYSALWGGSPYLRDMISWNMNYLLKKAPAGTVSSSNRRAAIKLLKKINSDPALRVVGQQKKIEQNDPEKILDEYVKRRIVEKTLRKVPDECTVLKLANEMVPEIGHEAAYLYAERYLPERLRYTLNILKANAAISRNDEAGWLDCLNQYLRIFKLEPLCLREGNSLLSRLSTKILPTVEHGPVVTVIMPAWNAQDTVEFAARSILNQTWRPLELIIVDDASSDNTWPILKQLELMDSRVKIIQNKINVGPYVSKNYALNLAKGKWITCHDADDFASPLRLESQLKEMISANLILSTTNKIRVMPSGVIRCSSFTNGRGDGVCGPSFISSMFNAHFFREMLGSWDSVKFGADGEIINRSKIIAEDRVVHLDDQLSMICMDLESSLTNNPIYGISSETGLSEPRREYLKNYKEWHNSISVGNTYLAFPMSITARPFVVSDYAVVSLQDIVLNIK